MAEALAPTFDQAVDPTQNYELGLDISSDRAAFESLGTDRADAVEVVTNLYTGETTPAESVSPEKSTFTDRAKAAYEAFRGVVRKGAAVAVGSLAIGATAEMVLPAAASASPAAVKKNQKAAPTTWSRLGGDSFIRGGVQTKHAFVRMITSKKGHKALRLQGLNTTEIKALDMAARKGEAYKCGLKYGEKFASMVFGINGTAIDRNVTFKDRHYKHKAAPAWCLDGKVRDKNGKVIEIVQTKTPRKCGNPAVKGIVVRVPVTPKAPAPKPKAPEAPAPCAGDTTNVNIGTAAQGGNCSINTVVQNCVANNSPGAEVCVTEQPPATTIPGTVGVNLIGPKHVKTDMIVDVCSYESAVNTSVIATQFSEVGQGEFISLPFAGDEPGEKCITYKAGTVAEADASISVLVTGANGAKASDTEHFPIDASTGEF